MPEANTADLDRLHAMIRSWSRELGFQQMGVADTDLAEHAAHLERWIDQGFHGDMDYMHRHGSKRTRPDELVPGTVRVISVRMDYFPPDTRECDEVLEDGTRAYISRYALGRDYHKLMRKRLQQLADRISAEIGEFGYRVFVDSAPVMEKALAERAGLGWIGKHTNLLNREAGSWFFLGELYTDLPLPLSAATSTQHCGDCTACIDVCPTQAIVAPYQLDARRCISYLTIENRDVIPAEFHAGLGNRIYGCDDCQLVCPWNRFSKLSVEEDFRARHELDDIGLLELLSWDEATFLQRTEGSAIRRIGFDCWQRNIIVALGNLLPDEAVETALRENMVSAGPVSLEQTRMVLAD